LRDAVRDINIERKGELGKEGRPSIRYPLMLSWIRRDQRRKTKQGGRRKTSGY